MLEVIEIILLLIILYYVVKLNKKPQRKMSSLIKKPIILKELTGRYKHKKTPKGNEFLVEYKKTKESEPEFRTATLEDRLLLIKAGFIKE